MKTALVTGGAGFIGSHLVDALLREQWHVTVADSVDPFCDPALKRQNIDDHLDHPLYRFVHVDIQNRAQFEAMVIGTFDVIVHLAARPGGGRPIDQAALYGGANIQGTEALLDFARARNIRQFVFASSGSVYGTNPCLPWREERDLPQPVSPYAATKAASELIGHVYSRLFGIRFTALRLFSVYGPRQRPDLAIHKFARAMVEGVPIPVYGDLESVRDYTSVADAIRGIRAAMEYTGSDYEVINLGGGRSHRLADVVNGLEQILGVRATLEFRRRPDGDLSQTAADISKARALLGYEPSIDLSAGLRAFGEWFEQHAGVSMKAMHAAV